MILFHRSLKRSEDIVRSLKRFFEVNCKTIDGIIETFNNQIGQGFVLKVLETYNRENDLVIWIYESLSNMAIEIGYGNHANLDEHNNWISKEKVNIKQYPIIKDIKRKIIEDIFENIKDYYSLNEEIEINNKMNI